jgi:predicted  nucleic acid-binding Zn-ribbon protein
MNELNRQLEKLEIDIRAAVVSGDEFLYSKLNRAKDELLQKIWFAESRNLKSEIETLETDRNFAISVRDDLLTESKQAADFVLQARGRLFDAEQVYQGISARQYFNDEQIEMQRKNIQELKAKLNSHINSKLLSGENNNE